MKPVRMALSCAVAMVLGQSQSYACPSHTVGASMIAGDVGDTIENLGKPPTVAAGESVGSLAPITSWKLNLTGAHGTSPNAQIHSYVSGTPADVQTVKYDSAYAYVTVTDVPSHSVGPFPGNPAYPGAVNRTLRIPRTPTEATTHASTGLGPIGVMSNGVFIFNAADARSYNNAGVWMQNANVVEAASFDAGPGHPAPGMGGGGGGGTLVAGTYHYHQSPAALLAQVDANTPASTTRRSSATRSTASRSTARTATPIRTTPAARSSASPAATSSVTTCSRGRATRSSTAARRCRRTSAGPR